MLNLIYSHFHKNRCLETYFCLFLKTLLLKSLLSKRLLQFHTGIAVLDCLTPFLPTLQKSTKCDLVHYLIKTELTYQSLYLHLHKYDAAIDHGRQALELSKKEISLRFRSDKLCAKNKAKIYKIQRMFETIVLVFYDMSFAYEGKVS